MMFFTTSYRSSLVPKRPFDSVPNTLSKPVLINMSDSDHLQPATMHSVYQVSWLNIKSHAAKVSTSFTKCNSAGMLQFSFSMKETSQKAQVCASLLLNRTIDEVTQIDSTFEYLKNLGMEIDKETERRRKKGLARKGKVPWNKGKKHSAETRELIKKRTKEALKDPKVRKKMFERQSHTHSTETKAKMVLGQKRAWTKRLKLKNCKDRFQFAWAEGIAESARKGWFGQQELEWDSYKKIKSEIALQHLQLAAETENARKTVKLLAVREKAEMMERRVLQRKKKQEKERSRREAKIKLQLEAKKQKEELSIQSKLKARLTKIRLKKSVKCKYIISENMASIHQPSIEKLDTELTKREKAQRETSFADKIQAAKQKKAESSVNGQVIATDVVTSKHQPDVDEFELEFMKTEKLKGELPLADRIQAAKQKRADTARKEHVNGLVTIAKDSVTTHLDFEKQHSKLSFADQIRAAKQKRAESSVNGQVTNAEDLITGHKPAITQLDLEIMKREKAQSKFSITDPFRAAKQKTAESSMKASVDDHVNGRVTIAEDVTTYHQQDIKQPELEFLRGEESQSTLSFAEQIRAAKQRRAESAIKGSVKHHSPVSS